jgi:hypothetical protein
MIFQLTPVNIQDLIISSKLYYKSIESIVIKKEEKKQKLLPKLIPFKMKMLYL